MDNNSAEDPSKKRDNAQVEPGDGEKPRKVRMNRADRHRSPTRRSLLRENRSRESSGNNASSNKVVERTNSEKKPESSDVRLASDNGSCERTAAAGVPNVWNLESALMYLVQVDGEDKEYLSQNGDKASPWVTFRVGHAGDASTIANWYRQATTTILPNDNPEVEIIKPAAVVDATTEPSEDESRTSLLEVWLADGLGDEDTPPAVHALMARIHRPGDQRVTSMLGAVALLTVDWDNQERILRVVWMHIDSSLEYTIAKTLEQRTWLRISTLAQMTACQIITVDGKLTLASEAKQSAKERPSPSAE